MSLANKRADQYLSERLVYKEITRPPNDTEQVSTPSSSSPEASSSSYIANIIRQIHITIDWLQRLSNLMMNEGLSSHGPRDDSQQRLTDEAGIDITDSVLARFEDMVLEKCPNLSTPLVWRLVTTMTTRQKNLICKRSNRRPRTPELEKLQRAPPKTLLRVWMDPESGRAVLPRAEEDYSNAVSATHDSYAESSLFQQDCKEDVPPYPTSWTRTHASPLKEGLWSPEASRPTLLGQEYICDYCHMTFSNDEALENIGWT